jgi:hypothetical protein
MPSPVRLFALFSAVLATQAACPWLFLDCPDTDSLDRTVDATALSAALADGELSFDECKALCDGPTEGTTTGAPTSGAPTTGGTDATGGSSSTGGGSSSTGGGASSSGGGTTTTTGDAVNDTGLVSCKAVEGKTDQVSCTYPLQCIGGRRPAGLRSEVACASAELGAWFAAVAHLEAASVPAFERLVVELSEHGAPAELIAAASAAADDERRHAAAIGAQAQRFGAEVAAVELAPARARPLVALARENAVEGCVHETWAALLAMHQAKAAEDPAVREVMAGIAADETRHAELAWAIDAWLRTRLSAAEVAEVEAARVTAAARLRPEAETPETHVHELGLPRRAGAEALWRALSEQLWAA